LETFTTSVRTFKTRATRGEMVVIKERLGNAQIRVVLFNKPSYRHLELSRL